MKNIIDKTLPNLQELFDHATDAKRREHLRLVSPEVLAHTQIEYNDAVAMLAESARILCSLSAVLSGAWQDRPGARTADPPVSESRPAGTQLYTVKEACAKLAISRTTLWRMIESGRLRVTRIGKAVRISEASLVAFVEAQR